MSAWMVDLAGRVGERWLSALALPGMVFAAAVAAAAVLGHRRALDFGRLADRADAAGSAVSGTSPGTALVAAIAVVLAATVAASLASGIGALVESGWFTRERAWSARGFGKVTRLPDLRASLLQRCSLDLATIWPPLWMHLGEEDRREVLAARAAVRDGFVRIAWGGLYAALGLAWWPMLPVGAALLWDGYRRAAAAMEVFTRTVEAVVQLHTPALAAQMGLGDAAVLDAGLGGRLTVFLRANLLPDLRRRCATRP